MSDTKHTPGPWVIFYYPSKDTEDGDANRYGPESLPSMPYYVLPEPPLLLGLGAGIGLLAVLKGRQK